MSGHDVERALIQSGLDRLAGRLDQAHESMVADLDAYGSDAASRYAEQLQAHQDRMRQIHEDQVAWLNSLYDYDEPAPAQDVGQQGPLDASGRGPATPAQVPAGQPDHAAELAEAERIRALPMTAWPEERQRLIRANRGLSSQETR